VGDGWVGEGHSFKLNVEQLCFQNMTLPNFMHRSQVSLTNKLSHFDQFYILCINVINGVFTGKVLGKEGISRQCRSYEKLG
jgi:hypothetical protein